MSTSKGWREFAKGTWGGLSESDGRSDMVWTRHMCKGCPRATYGRPDWYSKAGKQCPKDTPGARRARLHCCKHAVGAHVSYILAGGPYGYGYKTIPVNCDRMLENIVADSQKKEHK